MTTSAAPACAGAQPDRRLILPAEERLHRPRCRPQLTRDDRAEPTVRSRRPIGDTMRPDRFLTTRRGDFALLETGPRDGPRVLAVHGFPDTPLGMKPLADALAARGYRCVSPWLRGYAPSPIDGPFDLESLVADLQAIDAALDAEEVTASAPRPGAPKKYYVGHDWGAVLAWKLLAGRHGFARAALLAVPHPLAFLRGMLRDPRQLLRSRYMLFFQLGARADRAVARDDFAYVEALWRRWSPGFEPGPAYWAHLRETLARSHPAPLEYYRALTRPAGAALARAREGAADRIETPVLLLMGARDGCIAPNVAAGGSRFCAALETEILDGVGHFLHFEAPDLVASRIDRAFDRSG